ncbi:MAG: Sec-independent protein translocase TatA [Rhodobacterales bacterium]|nr:MAG: Sec-independent protein translocase TatA [Rhodobacterales bacterium]
MLNNIGPWGFLIVAILVLVLFGRGKVASLMGEFGKGISSFKKGVEEGKKEIEAEAADIAKDVTPEKEKEEA